MLIFQQKSLVRNLGQDYENNDAGGDVGVYIVYFVGFLEFVDNKPFYDDVDCPWVSKLIKGLLGE